MKSFRKTALPAAVAAILLLTGCGSSVPADGGSYKTATDLKDAFVKAGGQCDNWDNHNKTILAATSGQCGKKFALSVFDDTENFELQVSTMRPFGNLVIGKNWVISGLEAASVHKLLGGELVTKK